MYDQILVDKYHAGLPEWFKILIIPITLKPTVDTPGFDLPDL
jgi:hypothetical protein